MRRLVILTGLVVSILFFWQGTPSVRADFMPSDLGPPTMTMIFSPPPAPPPSGGFSASYSMINPPYYPTLPVPQPTFTLSVGTALFGGSSVGGFTVTNLMVDATPFTGNLPVLAPGSTTGSVNLSASNPFTLTNSGNGKTTTFMFTNQGIVVNEMGVSGGPVTGSLTNSVQLISSNDPSLNLSAYANGGTFMASFANIDFEETEELTSFPGGISPFQSVIGMAFYPSGPGQLISFTFTITPNVGGNSAIPEPGSLVLWGLAAAAGLSGLRRRYWKR